MIVEFVMNLGEGGSQVCGVEIPVIEEIIAKVSGLPQVGKQWFVRRTTLLKFPEAFLQARESIAQKGWGYDKNFLPYPWGEVAEFITKYMMCKGRYSTIFKYHLRILAHL